MSQIGLIVTLGLSVTINGLSILFIIVYFPVACHEKYEEYN